MKKKWTTLYKKHELFIFRWNHSKRIMDLK